MIIGDFLKALRQLSDPRFAYIHIDPSGTVQRVLFVDDVSNAPDDRP